MKKGRDFLPLFACPSGPVIGEKWSGREMERAGNGAGDGVRTRDPELGKLVLYQLSYTRKPPEVCRF